MQQVAMQVVHPPSLLNPHYVGRGHAPDVDHPPRQKPVGHVGPTYGCVA